MTILDLLRPPEIKINPGAPAILYNDKKILYNEINSLINKTSSFLREQGIKEDDIITLLYENSAEFILIVLSLWQLGAIPVPLNIKLLKEDLNEQIEFLNPKFTLKSKYLNNIFNYRNSLTIRIDELPENTGDVSAKEFSQDKTALILFTSGSSGKPKAVMLSFDNLIQSALIGNKVLNQTNKDKWLASLPFCHTGGFSIIFRALFFGASIIIPASLSNDDLIKSIKKHHPTLASLVSGQLKKFVETDFIPPEDLRLVLLGGGFSSSKLMLEAIEKGWRIAKVYGSTETSSFISFMNTEEVKKKPSASGRAIEPNQIIITDDGEITVKSPVVMKGYYKNDEENARKLKNGFYYSGDIGYLDDEGYLFIEAKRDDLIVTGGENVNPVEVENIILTHPFVREAYVAGVEDEKWGQIISAAIVVKENTFLTEGELKNFLKEKLASFKIPKKIIFVNQLPKSELGKILREEVKKLFI